MKPPWYTSQLSLSDPIRLTQQFACQGTRKGFVAVPNRSDARNINQNCSVALWNKFEHYDADRSFVACGLGFVELKVRRFSENIAL